MRSLRCVAESTKLSLMTIAVVTGSNRGIGLALCRALKERGVDVIAACRQASEELRQLGVEVVEKVDVATEQGVETLKNAVGSRRVDLLINNAGILVWGDSLDAPDYEGIRRQFEVNAVGPLRVTAALRQNLQKGSKIAFITSRMGSIADNTSGGVYGYRMSKAALNMAAMSVARDLEPAGIAVAILHPGMVSTEMIGMRGEIQPEEAAAGLLARIDELDIHNSGTFWHQQGQVLPW